MEDAKTFMSESINELALALSAFQGELEQPKLSKEVKVKTKTGGNYSFKYADLSTCVDAAKPLLKQHGLAVTQIVTNGLLTTLLIHSSGQWIQSQLAISLGGGADYQALGSAITYLKRYTYCAILGIVADTDDDANAACGNQATFTNGYTDAQLAKAKAEFDACKTRADGSAIWNKWSKDVPALCAQGSEFYKHVTAKLNILEQ